jgi:hypothetical protein
METTLKLAIETYAELTNRTFDEVVTEFLNKNEIVVENIIKLMFMAA